MAAYYRVFVVQKSEMYSDDGHPILQLADLEHKKYDSEVAAENWVKENGSKDYTYAVIKLIKPD